MGSGLSKTSGFLGGSLVKNRKSGLEKWVKKGLRSVVLE